MSPLPEAFAEHFRREGYHSRSNKHSNALALAIVDDLLAACPTVQAKTAQGMIVYELNFDLHVRTATWNVDLVLGRPGSPQPPDAVIRRGAPSTVEVAIEIKSVMTEHRKAVKNRKRDFEAHHEHVHQYNRLAIAGA